MKRLVVVLIGALILAGCRGSFQWIESLHYPLHPRAITTGLGIPATEP